jgi:hypothetical protein
MPFYHVSFKNYNTGDIISPGDWGKAIRSLDSLNHRAWLDMFLEDNRQRLNSAAISRLNCIYAFNNPTDAENFALSRQGAKIYELNVNSTIKTSNHNFKVISFFAGYLKGLPLALLFDNKALLEQYWTGDHTSTWTDCKGNNIDYIEEVLIGGQAVVTKIY